LVRSASKDYGGPGWTARQRYIFDKESYQAYAPTPNIGGIGLVGPVMPGSATLDDIVSAAKVRAALQERLIALPAPQPAVRDRVGEGIAAFEQRRKPRFR
jgi:hypothetical protein